MLQNSTSGNLLSQISSIRNMLSGKNPDDLYNNMIQNTPQFKSFVDANKGKTPEQIASENGLDFNSIKTLL